MEEVGGSAKRLETRAHCEMVRGRRAESLVVLAASDLISTTLKLLRASPAWVRGRQSGTDAVLRSRKTVNSYRLVLRCGIARISLGELATIRTFLRKVGH